MYPAGNLFIPAPHGQLEAILKEPREGNVRGVALVLHPHPLGGGTMHNKVVFRAAAALNEAGLMVLRINFRGVGQSTGEHDEYGELQRLRDLVAKIHAPVELKVIKGAGHFFDDQLDELKRAITEWVLRGASAAGQ